MSCDPDLHPRWPQRRRFLNIFPIGSYMYVKTMFADGSHLGWRSGSLHKILKVDHLKTIHAMFVMVLYQICVFGVDRKFNMAARANNVFRLVETLKIPMT
jgi:hypothetical protein